MSLVSLKAWLAELSFYSYWILQPPLADLGTVCGGISWQGRMESKTRWTPLCVTGLHPMVLVNPILLSLSPAKTFSFFPSLLCRNPLSCFPDGRSPGIQGEVEWEAAVHMCLWLCPEGSTGNSQCICSPAFDLHLGGGLDYSRTSSLSKVAWFSIIFVWFQKDECDTRLQQRSSAYGSSITRRAVGQWGD